MVDTKNKPVMFRFKEVDVVREGGDIVRYTVMVPHQRFADLCKRQYELDGDYALARIENRSRASHNHYFAALNDAFDNLPEVWAKKFPTSEHMRKWVLVTEGYRHEEVHDFDTEKDAKQFALAIRRRDEFSVIKRAGAQVMIWSAKSQDHRSMGKQEFEDSKKAVLDYVAGVIGVSLERLEQQASEKVPKRVNG